MKKLILLALVSGCTTVASEDILTHGMYADIDARANANGETTVSTTLYLGSPINLDFIELSAGDQLVATNSPDTKVMQETSILNIVSYHATFQTTDEDEVFEIGLERSVDSGAPSSLVSLPSPFTIIPPVTSQSRAASMSIAWSPAATTEKMSWTAKGTCIESTGEALAGDPGSFVIPAGRLIKRVPQGAEAGPDSCQVTIEISRQREGDLDPGYGKGGTIFGTQSRTTTFTTTP